MSVQKTILGSDHSLSVSEVARIARDPRHKVSLSKTAERSVRASRALVERMVQSRKIVYGVTTGFGSLKSKVIQTEQVAELQRNLIRSHSAGVGAPLSHEAVRASLLVRLNSLAQGFSGVRFELLDFLCEMLNRNIIPYVPSQGSVGSSGDLAPLSHMGLVLMGEGKAWYRKKFYSGKEALRRAGLQPFQFAAKEGLAWNNGTSVMTGIGALAVADAERLALLADVGCALSLEALCGVTDALDRRIHILRHHPGQQRSAEVIRRLVSGSRLVDSISDRIQDAYSIRCAPQVHGAARDTIDHVHRVVERELNAVTDNPLIFPQRPHVRSGGNFHGEPVAIGMDSLAIALSELANISERRIAKMVDAATSEGLPPFLIPSEKAGLHSGFMLAQYTAAALVSENKVLAHPASVDSIPTSANQEDHVSMGTIAARKVTEIVRNAENVLAIECLAATQGIDLRLAGAKLGRGTRAAYTLIRRLVPVLTKDRILADDIVNIQKAFPILYERINRIVSSV